MSGKNRNFAVANATASSSLQGIVKVYFPSALASIVGCQAKFSVTTLKNAI